MDFNAKNFSYVTKTVSNAIDDMARDGKRLYMRALSEDKPADQPADLRTDFPQLAEDFAIPDALSLVSESTFSTVLRMSGPVNMWLHYDVSLQCTFVLT